MTSDDLPMPRAPHSSALLAATPLAKRCVFSSRMSRTRSMPFSNGRSTRFTFATGCSQAPSACQTKASASSSVVAGVSAGTARATRASNASSLAFRSRNISSANVILRDFVCLKSALVQARAGIARCLQHEKHPRRIEIMSITLICAFAFALRMAIFRPLRNMHILAMPVLAAAPRPAS